MGSFIAVITAFFGNLFSDPGALLAILGTVGVLLGWGIYTLICKIFGF